MPKLIYNPGRLDESTFELGQGCTVIGRADLCEIPIAHKSLSRRHAQLEIADGRVILSDLQSKNGTFVNGLRVDRRDLASGDIVKLGDLIFSFHDAAAPDPKKKEPRGRGPDGILDLDAVPPTLLAVAPTLVVGLEREPIERLLHETTGASALKVKLAEPGQRAQDKLQILLRVNQILSSSAELGALLQRILELIFQVFDVDRAAILLVDPASLRLEPRAVKSAKGIPQGRAIYSQQIVEYVRQHRIAALFTDAAADPRLDAGRSIIHQSIRASMCVPLHPKDDVIGVIYVDNLSTPNRFSEEDLEFFASFAGQAAIAVENIMLCRRIEEEAVKRTQLVMQEKLASLGVMVSGIAHELRNPLNFINNFAELSVGLTGELCERVEAQRPRLDPGGAAEILDALGDLQQNVAKIAEHGNRANGIINGMLLHARGSSGARELVDLNALVAESASLAYRGMQTQDPGFFVEIRADYGASIGPVELVSADLRRVFINVIDNACYAMRRKRQELGARYTPELVLRTVDRGDRVEVAILDNGTGIPPEIADRIYTPFFSTKPPGEGTGLGLSISHDIVVEGHQGEMRMETVPGESTALTITLPRRSMPPSQRKIRS